MGYWKAPTGKVYLLKETGYCFGCCLKGDKENIKTCIKAPCQNGIILEEVKSQENEKQ